MTSHPITAADARISKMYWNGRLCKPSDIADQAWNLSPGFAEEEDPDGDYDEGGAFGDCTPDQIAASRTAADSSGAVRSDSFITLDIEGEHLYQDAGGTWLSYQTGKPCTASKALKKRKQAQRGRQS